MRVCILTEYFYPDCTGGTPAVLSALARRLHDHYPDLELEVITSRNLYRGAANSLSAFEEWDGIPIHRVAAPKSNRPGTVARLAAGALFTTAAFAMLNRRPRYDLVFVGTNPPTAPEAAQWYRFLRGVPYTYLIHDLYPDLALALGLLSRKHPAAQMLTALQRGWLHRARSVVVIGRCMKEYLHRTYGLSPARIEVITNWSDPEAIVPRDTATAFRTRHGLTGTVVLYAGNFGQYQNFDDLLDAAERLQTPHPDLTVVFVGDGARREYLENAIATRKLRNVRMYGFVPEGEFCDLLASADVSLVTLEPGAEGLGVPSKFYNILASGRPSVAIVAPGSEVAHVLAEADCGVRVDHGQPDRLAEVLASLHADAAGRSRLGANARKMFLERYTLPAVAAQYHSAFLAALGRAPAPSPVADESGTRCAT
jgi:glycosyltransferase involved in cell wall biosynthesis